jgi:TolB-like protein/tetratricopeptide (TPR) repeat protein
MKTTASFVIVLILVFAGCTTRESSYVKDGTTYGVTSGLFRDRWWNYYERGLSFAQGEFYQKAISDLQTAIEKRESDQWRSRTYGMHFVNYFPHRELGVIYFKLNQYDSAERELEDSLATADSSKAKYFLNRTRKAILDETGEDTLPPQLKIDYPEEGTITNNFSISLKGKAEDDFYISSVSVNSLPLLIELANKRIQLEQELILKRGINEINIKATDLTGKITEERIKIDVDREGPVVIIEDQITNDRKVILSGYLTDRSGITSFLINGTKIPLTRARGNIEVLASGESGQEIKFRQEIEMTEDTEKIIVKVEDRAANVTTGEIMFSSYDTALDHIMPQSILNNTVLLASSQPVHTGIIHDQYAFTGSGLKKLIDNIPPIIHLKDMVDFQTVYTDSLFLEGSVSDKSKIVSLLINGESILKREGKKIFFNYLTRLKEGINRFFIETKDNLGNSSEKVIEVNRKIPKIRQIGSRMSISILPLESAGAQSVSAQSVYESLIASFVNQRRFHVIERERMEEVLRELKLSQTDLVDPSTASKVGKIVVADAILTGTIYENKGSIEVLTRLVDTETSRILEANDVFDEDMSLPGVKKLTEGLALKYKQSFPLVEGMLIEKDGKSILTDMGSDKEIRQDMGIILFREGDELRHPSTGKILGAEPVELGEAKVENVYKEFSRATIKKGKPAQFRIKDKIITK